MFSLMRIIAIAFCLSAPGLMCGCSDSPSAPVTQPATPNVPGVAGVSSTSDSKLTLTAGQVFGDTKKFENPDAATLEQQARALNWENPKERPLIHLARLANNGAWSVTIKVQGTLGTPNEDGAFRAGVIGVDEDNTTWTAETPLESVDKAVELLLIAREDPKKLRAISKEWATEDGGDATE